MRLDFSNFWQLQTLFYSLGVGVLLCLSYDVIRFINRLVKPGAVVVFIMDLLYWVYAAAVTFSFFMLFSKGVIRFYAYIGFLVGFIISRVTVSKLFMLLLDWLNRFVAFLLKKISIPINFVSKKMKAISKSIRDFLLKYKNKFKKAEKNKKSCKKTLKD